MHLLSILWMYVSLKYIWFECILFPNTISFLHLLRVNETIFYRKNRILFSPPWKVGLMPENAFWIFIVLVKYVRSSLCWNFKSVCSNHAWRIIYNIFQQQQQNQRAAFHDRVAFSDNILLPKSNQFRNMVFG